MSQPAPAVELCRAVLHATRQASACSPSPHHHTQQQQLRAQPHLPPSHAHSSSTRPPPRRLLLTQLRVTVQRQRLPPLCLRALLLLLPLHPLPRLHTPHSHSSALAPPLTILHLTELLPLSRPPPLPLTSPRPPTPTPSSPMRRAHPCCTHGLTAPHPPPSLVTVVPLADKWCAITACFSPAGGDRGAVLVTEMRAPATRRQQAVCLTLLAPHLHTQQPGRGRE